MLVVISPAKSLDWSERPGIEQTAPQFGDEALRLAKTSRQLTLTELQKLMSISPDLAKLNRDRFRAFSDAPQIHETRPAALAFNGDTYQGLEAGSFDADDWAWADDRLRILSGLYGVLRPRDAIQPYRLEMGSRLKTRRGKTLYDFWGEAPAKALSAQAETLGTDTLVNCASQEYFGAVDLKALGLRVITPVFMEDKAGTPKIVSFFAKRARGAMARFMVTRRVTDPEGLRDFDLGGYSFQPEMSEGDRWVFLRDYPEVAKAS